MSDFELKINNINNNKTAPQFNVNQQQIESKKQNSDKIDNSNNLKKENHLKRLKKFCRILEKNSNNFVNLHINFDPHRIIKGLYLRLDSVNGIKKIMPKEKIIGKKFFLRFFVTFYHTASSQFFGNTYRSPLLNIRFNESGHYELNETDPIYVYFLSDTSDPKNGVVAILEVLFVETAEDLRIINQSCEGWSIIELQESPPGKMGISSQIFNGTPRNLMHRAVKNFIPLSGASIIYSCNLYQELLNLRFLLPMYTILGYSDILPGILMRYLPRKAVLNEQIRLTQFSDIYLKNVEIEVSKTFESDIIEYARKYRTQKYDIPQNANLNPIVIKERKLKIGIHNTFTFINSNGIQNSISLTKKENILFFKGVSHLDNYFKDEYCAFVFELNYHVSLPIMNNREDFLNLIIGYAISIPKKITMENKFKSFNLITGPGTTVYGENLLEALDPRDKYIKFNFILSKNKDTYDRTYREKEIESLKQQMENLQKNMQEEYTKQLLNEKLKFDKERDEMLKKKQLELEEMDSRLRESQRSLKAVYDKDDHYDNQYINEMGQNYHNQNKISENHNYSKNEKFDPNLSQQIPNISTEQKNYQTQNLFNAETANSNFNINTFKKNPIFHEEQMNIGDNIINDRNRNFENEDKDINSDFNFRQENKINFLNSNEKHRSKFQTPDGLDLGIPQQNLKNEDNFNVNNYNYPNYQATNQNNRYDQSQLNNFGNTAFNLNPTNMDLNSTNNKFFNGENTQNAIFNAMQKNFYNTAGPNIPFGVNPGFEFNPNMMNTNFNNMNNYTQNISNDPNLHFDTTTKDISRREKADLMAKGILNMQIIEKSPSMLNYTFDNEIKDDKKANNFIVSFLAFKPLPDIKDYKSIPDKIHFKFDFWDFDCFITKSAIINKPSSDIVPSNTPLVITREGVPLSAKTDEKEMKIQIDFDPSIDNKIDFKEFIDYLLTKNLFVEVYDSEKLNQIGYLKIPLRDFLRQGKNTIFHTKEYDLFDYNFMLKGSIQVLIKTIGYHCSKTFEYDPHYLKMINTKDKYSNTNKKKKVKTSQIKLDKLSEINKENLVKAIIEKTENNEANNLMNNKNNTIENQEVLIKGLKLNLDPETQKRLRALKYSSKPTDGANPLSNLKLNKFEELKSKQIKENEFIKSLTYVNKIKEQTKKEIIEKTIQENNKNIVTLDLVAGQNHYFNFIIQNTENIDELVQVVITKQKNIDKDSNKEINQEFIDKEHVVNLVTDPDEWKSYVENNKLFRPDDYSIISAQNFLIMRPRESIPLLLRIKSFNLNLKDFTYVVWVYKKEGQPLYNLYLNIRKVFPILDHCYRYYLSENRISNIKFPNPFKFDKNKIQMFLDNYHSTDSHISLQIDTVTNEIFFRYRTNSESSETSFYLFIFLDNKKAHLYATWKFDIYSIHSIDVHAQIGAKVIQKLNLEERNAYNVQFYSTNEEILYLPEKYKKPMVLIPNLSNEIRCVINPKQYDTYEVLLNCVNISSRELIKTWLFKIMADKPEISHVHKIDCKINQVLNFKYEFGNPLNHHMIFNFESNSLLLKIIDTRLPFNGGEKKLLNISIPPQNHIGRAEILMFVSDVEELYTETILFQLNFK